MDVLAKRFRAVHTGLFLSLIVFLTVLHSVAYAKLVELSIEELAQKSDSVVVGRLTNVSDFAQWTKVTSQGIIEVDEVIFGSVKIGDKIPVKWIFHPIASFYGDMNRDPAPALWFLTDKKPGYTFSPNHCRLDISKKSQVIKALENPVRVEQVVEPAAPDYSMRLIYRNATSHTMELPLMEFTGGKLHVPEGTTFSVITYESRVGDSYFTELDCVKDSLVFSKAPDIVRLAPGQSYGVSVPFNALYPFKADSISFQWSLPDIGQSNRVEFRPVEYFHSDLEDEDDYSYASPPLWFRIYILLSYSPTREILIALCVGIPALIWFFANMYIRKRRQQPKGI